MRMELKRAARDSAFTLSEMMTAMAVFSLAVVGFIYTQLFGLRMDELVNSKIGAAEQARMSFGDLSADVRAAKIWQVGNGNINGFTAIPLGMNQRGNALKLSLTTDTNTYYLYYFDTNACKLIRSHSGSQSKTYLAQYLTNTMYFQAENYHGDNQTNLTHKGVIAAIMQFYQYQFPITKIGPGNYYDYYRLELRLTPHVPDGP